ncbi:urease accessory protein UreD [Thalassospira sp.]|uniref:urease accessory protein UreD n=1 Tax=Thalassospira sp. TaxID=1912094 RepID=UPI0027375380|nr:urease accessory protein UreD [Thalassospira sp.]MDP2698921.1 urease accessory protein UreD [Thalassospira sp.]
MQLRKINNPVHEDVISKAPLRPVVTNGRAEVTFQASDRPGAQAVLDHLYYRDPMKILFPRPMADDLVAAALVTTSGGMVGGDCLAFEGGVGPGAAGLFTAQAAEKIYRSLGPDCKMDVVLRAADGGWLEWLPQETILFDGARLRRTTQVHVTGSGRVLAGEIMVFGRLARGEVFDRGLARDAWDVTIDGRPVWRDALHLEGDIRRILDHPASFAGARACATAILAGQDAASHLDFARACLLPVAGDAGADDGSHDGVLAAATAINGVLVMRWLSPDPMKLRRSYGAWWAAFRHGIQGLPARLPRLWDI